MTTAPPSFEHLLRLSDGVGVFEHAVGAIPNWRHGYCVDDVARALIVIVQEVDPAPDVAALGDRCLTFLQGAQCHDGRFHNRRGLDRRWQDTPGTGDWWGRALWALGIAAVHHPQGSTRESARRSFDLGARWRSPFPRSMAFAALGAAEIVAADADDTEARALLVAAAASVGRPAHNPGWPWPEPRLTYANAIFPDALIAAGTALGDEQLVNDGLRLLEWLVAVETRDGHLSPTAVGGWGPGEPRRRFDQQPIEVAALASACARAFRSTGEPRWSSAVDLAVGWFAGDNDAGLSLLNPSSGGGYDGLTATGCNTNQGAESTLALIATSQLARGRVRAGA